MWNQTPPCIVRIYSGDVRHRLVFRVLYAEAHWRGSVATNRGGNPPAPYARAASARPRVRDDAARRPGKRRGNPRRIRGFSSGGVGSSPSGRPRRRPTNIDL